MMQSHIGCTYFYDIFSGDRDERDGTVEYDQRQGPRSVKERLKFSSNLISNRKFSSNYQARILTVDLLALMINIRCDQLIRKALKSVLQSEIKDKISNKNKDVWGHLLLKNQNHYYLKTTSIIIIILAIVIIIATLLLLKLFRYKQVA